MVRELAGHNAGIECMAFSADGLTLVSGGEAYSAFQQNSFEIAQPHHQMMMPLPSYGT